MPLCRSEVTVIPRSADPAHDDVVHTVYHFISGAAPDYDAQATAVSAAFSAGTGGGATPFITYSGRKNIVKCYDMTDAKPRPVKGTHTYNPATPESAPLGPRQVSVCLSFYAGQNTPRRRGRLFLGPWILAIMGETVDATTRGRVLDLGHALHGITANGSVWHQHSEAGNTSQAVTDIWCNDVWDTIRGRLPREGVRTRATA